MSKAAAKALEPVEEEKPTLTYPPAPMEYGPALPIRILYLKEYTDGQGLSAQRSCKAMDDGAAINQVRYLIWHHPAAGVYRIAHFPSGSMQGRITNIERANVLAAIPRE